MVLKMKKKVIIIGAGTAGLASAIRLQSKGFDVVIYEKNPQVGGRMYSHEEKGYRFDVGPTIVMMPEIYREVFEYSGANPDDYLSMQLLDPLYQLHYQDGTSFSVSSNLTKLIPALEKVSHEDTQGYLAYLADIYKRYNIARQGFLDRSFHSAKDIFSWKNIRDTIRLRTLNSAYSSISKFVKNEKLRQALSFQTLYIGVSPFVGPSIYTVIPMIELLYGIWYIQGGMYAMAKAMQRRFEELGGRVVLNTNIEKINVVDKKAVGIIVKGQAVAADIVLVNADFPYAVSHLLEEKDRGKYTPSKIKKMEYSSSSFIMYFGLNKKIKTSVHQIRYAKNFKKNIDDLFEPTLPEDPSFYIYSPTQIDETVAPEGKEIIYVLVPVPNREGDQFSWDEAMTKTYRDKLVEKMKLIPGFETFDQTIEIEKVMTPKDWQAQFNLQFAATFGLKPILLQSNFFRPQAKALKIKNLYFTGTSTHPGAGIPIVMKSAKIVSDTIIEESKP